MQYSDVEYSIDTRNFIYKVYAWMSFALAITAGVAYYVFASNVVVATNKWLLFGVIMLQLALVIIISTAIFKLSYAVAVFLFMIYAASVGVTMSFIFGYYEIASIYATFVVTAGMFAVTCVYGYVTKADLTSMGSFAFMGLIGLILGGLVNMFLSNSMFDFILSAIGIFIFTLLTAYDSQKIKQMGQQLMESKQTRNKVAILGALTLYLDFINLFLYLLRFIGQKRED